MNNPAASSGVSSFVLGRHSVLDTESRIVFWIPACAGMTNSLRAAGNTPEDIESSYDPRHDTEALEKNGDNINPLLRLPS